MLTLTQGSNNCYFLWKLHINYKLKAHFQGSSQNYEQSNLLKQLHTKAEG